MDILLYMLHTPILIFVDIRCIHYIYIYFYIILRITLRMNCQVYLFDIYILKYKLVII